MKSTTSFEEKQKVRLVVLLLLVLVAVGGYRCGGDATLAALRVWQEHYSACYSCAGGAMMTMTMMNGLQLVHY